jgi:hypothetical protein
MPNNRNVAALLLLRRRRKRRRWWVHPINVKRLDFGEYHHLMPDLRDDEQKFHRYFRMEMEEFDFLLYRLTPFMHTNGSNWRLHLSPEERLVVTLR